MTTRAHIKTPIGTALIKGNQSGISSLSWIEETEISTTQEIPEELKYSVTQLQSYFKGDLKKFNLPLNPKGTDFQEQVWQALSEIPYGKTISYLQLAQNIGNSKTVRAVAATNGKNPLPILIPCHRVIGSDGSLTGYSGGLWRKKWLLKHEGALKQTSLF
ncbi:MAG TPA: methylated-DNA--[protein]-cysteine S-methyltransferase [Flavobacteriaceae bacterium]|nr:methylated-DNA--[protein]-cysteine S-methyltransferase [Flavobacteriaceae bacterium]